MKMDKILDEIWGLSHSQGFYGRLYRDIMELQKEDPEAYEEYKKELESQHFQNTLDMVLYFEE